MLYKRISLEEERRSWKKSVDTAFEYSTEVLSADPIGDESYAVTAHIAGDFPGSPVRLQYHFTLSDTLTSELVIAP